MLKKVLTTFAAMVCAGGIALGANLTLMSGPQDPSQLLASLNALIQSINSGVSGRLYANTTSVGNSTTIEATLMTYSLPANTLANVGDAVRVVCWGTVPANGDVKNAKLYFGASAVDTTSIAASIPSGKKWRLELLAVRSGAATQVVMGTGVYDLTYQTVYTNSGTDSLTAAVVIKCTGTGAGRQDITAQGMYVEQVK